MSNSDDERQSDDPRQTLLESLRIRDMSPDEREERINSQRERQDVYTGWHSSGPR